MANAVVTVLDTTLDEASRSVDGGSADSTVRVINTRNADLVTHT